MKIKEGDKVIVLTGKDKGKTGKVTKVLALEGKVTVEGVNVVKKHRRGSRQGQSGQIVEKVMPVDISNVAVADPKTGEATRIGFTTEDGNKKRVAKKSGEVID